VKKDPANAQIQLCDCFKQTSENTEGTIKNGQSRDTGGIAPFIKSGKGCLLGINSFEIHDERRHCPYKMYQCM
jgi:hypothetical protein